MRSLKSWWRLWASILTMKMRKRKRKQQQQQQLRWWGKRRMTEWWEGAQWRLPKIPDLAQCHSWGGRGGTLQTVRKCQHGQGCFCSSYWTSPVRLQKSNTNPIYCYYVIPLSCNLLLLCYSRTNDVLIEKSCCVFLLQRFHYMLLPTVLDCWGENKSPLLQNTQTTYCINLLWFFIKAVCLENTDVFVVVFPNPLQKWGTCPAPRKSPTIRYLQPSPQCSLTRAPWRSSRKSKKKTQQWCTCTLLNRPLLSIHHGDRGCQERK